MTRFISKKFTGLKAGDKVSAQQDGSHRVRIFTIAELDVEPDTAERFIAGEDGVKLFESNDFTVEILQRGDRVFG